MTAPTPDTRARRTVRSAVQYARRDLLRWGRDEPGTWASVAVGVAIGVVAILAKAGMNVVLGSDSGFVVLMAAAVSAAWVAGLPAGITATIVAAGLNVAIFVAPETSATGVTTLALTPLDVARMGLYVLAGAIVSAIVASLRTSRGRLAASLAELATLAVDLERRDERLELVLAASGTGFWEWDVRSGALTWSRAIFEQHGLDPAAGPPTYERYIGTIHEDDRPTFERSIADALDHGESFSHEFRIVWPDGSIHWTHGVARVFRDAGGRPVRMVGTGQDITQRRRLEEERDALLADERRAGSFREAFIEVISHELRTPITTIFGLTQILTRPGRQRDPDESAALIGDIAADSERLHRLVEDLLVLTRAERGEFAVEAEPLELRRLLAKMVEREAKRLPGLSISVELEADLPVVVGEETYVEQVVRNMLSNASKYTPDGTRVVVRVERLGDDVAVRVLDSGPGIDARAAEQAFELFYRDPTSARTVAGSGIGLFVCASLVEAMGGTIWARPRPEGGSEFGFTLLGIPDDEPASPEVPLATA